MSDLTPLGGALPTAPDLFSSAEVHAQDVALRLAEAHRRIIEVLPPQLAVMSSGDMQQLTHRTYHQSMRGWRCGESLMLLGDTGGGKTVAAAYIYKRLVLAWSKKSEQGLDAAKRIRWVTAMQLGVARREEQLGRMVDLLERAKRASVLIIDDVGQSSNRDDLFDVMDHRYFRGAPTLITSGLHQEDMQERFGMELWRRLTSCRGRRSVVVEHWGGRL